MRALLLAIPAVLLVGCVPQLRGICSTNADCPSETECVENICVAPATTKEDAGPGNCSPDCGSGMVCDDGTCVSDSTSFVNIISPGMGAAVNGSPLTVLLQAHAPETITSVEVSLNAVHGSVSSAAASPTTGDGYSTTLSLASSTITDGDYQLVATMTCGGKTVISSPVSIIVDKIPPTITFDPVTYPTRTSGSPATGFFLRDEQVTLDVDVTASVAGLSPSSPPKLTANGMSAVTGQPTTGHTYQFTFSGRGPTFPEISGPVAVEVTATDAAGNQTQASGSFQLTRRRWVWQKPRAGSIPTAPAIADTILVLGGDESFLYGVRRASGDESWEVSTTYPPVGHISIGTNGAYVVTSRGYVAAVNPTDILAGNRVVFSCPDGTPTALEAPLRTLVSGGALGTTPYNGTNDETLFVFTEDGHLQLFRKDNFPGTTPDCDIETAVTAFTNDSSVPALLPEGTSNVVFVGDTGDALNKVTIAPPATANGSFTFTNSWSYSTGAAVDGPPALAQENGGTGVLVGDSSGALRALDLNKNLLWTFGPLEELTGLRASPVVDSSFVYLLDQAGNADKITVAGNSVWGTPIATSTRSATANAAPVVAKDGSSFMSSGTEVAALNGSGNPEWSFDISTTTQYVSGQVVDAVSPMLSCEGDLYIVASSASQSYVHDIITDSAGGPAADNWPRSFHDNHNTSNISTSLVGTTCTE